MALAISGLTSVQGTDRDSQVGQCFSDTVDSGFNSTAVLLPPRGAWDGQAPFSSPRTLRSRRVGGFQAKHRSQGVPNACGVPAVTMLDSIFEIHRYDNRQEVLGFELHRLGAMVPIRK